MHYCRSFLAFRKIVMRIGGKFRKCIYFLHPCLDISFWRTPITLSFSSSLAVVRQEDDDGGAEKKGAMNKRCVLWGGSGVIDECNPCITSQWVSEWALYRSNITEKRREKPAKSDHRLSVTCCTPLLAAPSSHVLAFLRICDVMTITKTYLITWVRNIVSNEEI